MTKRREFKPGIKREAWERAKGNCEKCKLPFRGQRPEYHHRKEAFIDGPATLENCLCVCRACHAEFTREAAGRMAKTRRQIKSEANAKPKRRGFRCWRKFDGTAVYKD